MSVASSIFLLLGFVLSVVVSPQIRVWTWGAPMVFLAVAAALALPAILRQQLTMGQKVITALGLAVVAWLGVRAYLSPVQELAAQDFLLVAMAVATWVAFQAVSTSAVAQRILYGGIALLVIASLWMMSRQMSDPTFNPIIGKSRGTFPSGFHWHYSHCAAFLTGAGLLLAGLALGSKASAIFRIFAGLVGVAALGAIFYTKSRSGMIGMGGGILAFVAAILLIGKRDKRKWFLPAAFILPFLLIAGSIGYLNLASEVFEERGTEGITAFDNTARLALYSIAFSCITLHPLIGGGAESFSWESMRFWDVKAMGYGGNRPGHVHNELVQTVSDYGLVGAGLLVCFLVAGVVLACVRLQTRAGTERGIFADAWRLGGLGGFLGVFVSSNFEGTLRNPPGAVLLALCIAAMCFPLQMASQAGNGTGRKLPTVGAMATALSAMIAVAFLGIYGVKSTRTSLILWPTFYHPETSSTETRINAYSDAIAVWPLFSFYQDRAELYRKQADGALTEEERTVLLRLSLNDFRKASILHPFDPWPILSAATLLDTFGEEAAADESYRRGIKAQGGLEAGFHGKYLYANFLEREGVKEDAMGRTEAARDSFAQAARYMDESSEKDGGGGALEHYRLRVGVHENYGLTLEALGDYAGALQQYNLASTLPYGTSAHFRAAALLSNRATDIWGKREGSAALRLFLDARQRIDQAQELPRNITPEKVDEWRKYIDQSIGYLKAAFYEPSEKVDL